MADISADEWHSLSEYLDQALDLDESARAAWLTTLAKIDPAMAVLVAKALAVRDHVGFSGFLAETPSLVVQEIGAVILVGRTVPGG
jgi:hypothetical protein